MLAYLLTIAFLSGVVAAFSQLLVVHLLLNHLFVLLVEPNVKFECCDLYSKVSLHYQSSPSLVVVLGLLHSYFSCWKVIVGMS